MDSNSQFEVQPLCLSATLFGGLVRYFSFIIDTLAHAKGAYKLLRKRVFFFVFKLICLLFLSFALPYLLPTATALRSQIRFSLYKKDFFRFAIVRKGFSF